MYSSSNQFSWFNEKSRSGGSGLKWRGQWNALYPYQIYDLVSYLGNVYISMKQNLGTIPTSSTTIWNTVVVGANGISAGNNIVDVGGVISLSPSLQNITDIQAETIETTGLAAFQSLGVSGVASFSSELLANDGITALGNSLFYGTLFVHGVVGLLGSTNIASLSATTTEVNNTLVVHGNTTLNSNLNLTNQASTSTFLGNVTFGTEANVTQPYPEVICYSPFAAVNAVITNTTTTELNVTDTATVNNMIVGNAITKSQITFMDTEISQTQTPDANDKSITNTGGVMYFSNTNNIFQPLSTIYSPSNTPMMVFNCGFLLDTANVPVIPLTTNSQSLSLIGLGPINGTMCATFQTSENFSSVVDFRLTLISAPPGNDEAYITSGCAPVGSAPFNQVQVKLLLANPDATNSGVQKFVTFPPPQTSGVYLFSAFLTVM